MTPENLPVPQQEVIRLRDRIIDEIFFAFGLSRNGLARKLLGPIVSYPAAHFAAIVAKYQAMVPELGFGLTARQALPQFNTVVTVRGLEQVPVEGPLLVASNHIGGVDTLAVASCITRKDLKIMVSDVSFLRSMSIADDYFIFVPQDTPGRMAALHQAIDHMRAGGAVLVFPHGEVEPDPELMPGARESIEEWSPSLEIILRKVPAARIQIAIVSGVINPAFMRNIFVKLRRTPFARQKLAEFLQIMQQMIFPQKLQTNVHISLSQPLSPEGFGEGRIMPGLISTAQALLDSHLNDYPAGSL